MRKKYLRFILAVVLIMLIAFVGIGIHARVLSKNADIPSGTVMIPKGIADRYKDALLFSFDDYRIWQYELKDEEIQALSADLNRGTWLRAEGKARETIESFFEFGDDSFAPSEISENDSFCIYDVVNRTFVDLDSDKATLGWHRLLFFYDDSAKTYWCVSKSV